GAKVGPRTSARSLPSGSGPSAPSHTIGRMMKYTAAIRALASIARGTLRFGLIVSPTWQEAASKAGAAKPMRYRPAIKLVTVPNHPENGTFKWNVDACTQSTRPEKTGAMAETKASPADVAAIGVARRTVQRIPQRFTIAKNATIQLARISTRAPGRYHCWIADADMIAVKPQVGPQPHQWQNPLTTQRTRLKAGSPSAHAPPTR